MLHVAAAGQLDVRARRCRGGVLARDRDRHVPVGVALQDEVRDGGWRVDGRGGTGGDQPLRRARARAELDRAPQVGDRCLRHGRQPQRRRRQQRQVAAGGVADDQLGADRADGRQHVVERLGPGAAGIEPPVLDVRRPVAARRQVARDRRRQRPVVLRAPAAAVQDRDHGAVARDVDDLLGVVAVPHCSSAASPSAACAQSA